MSRSIGSHILLEKLVQPNWDFVRNLLVRAKIASNLLVGKVCEQRPRVQDQHGVHRTTGIADEVNTPFRAWSASIYLCALQV